MLVVVLFVLVHWCSIARLNKKRKAFPYIIYGSNPACIQSLEQTHETGGCVSVSGQQSGSPLVTDCDVHQYSTQLVTITLMDENTLPSVLSLSFFC